MKNGKVAGLSRFRCRAEGCKRSYTALSGTQLSRLRFKEKWEAYQDCLRQRLTLEQATARCGVSKTTAFKWRHRFIAEVAARMPLEGVVEMDATYFLESEKGSRTLRQRRKPRKCGGETYASEIGTRQGTRIPATALPATTFSAVMKWSIAGAIVTRDSTSHLNIVNNRHEVMKSMLNRQRRGIATKYLDNYMNWF